MPEIISLQGASGNLAAILFLTTSRRQSEMLYPLVSLLIKVDPRLCEEDSARSYAEGLKPVLCLEINLQALKLDFKSSQRHLLKVIAKDSACQAVAAALFRTSPNPASPVRGFPFPALDSFVRIDPASNSMLIDDPVAFMNHRINDAKSDAVASGLGFMLFILPPALHSAAMTVLTGHSQPESGIDRTHAVAATSVCLGKRHDLFPRIRPANDEGLIASVGHLRDTLRTPDMAAGVDFRHA